jgi:light-regulated signal transduction histidine kinase (bacteriophytochrome)
MASLSVEERLAEALDENSRLRQSLDSCTSTRESVQHDLEQAQSALTASADELKGIVYAVTHDVKTALRSVSSYAQLLFRQAPPNEQSIEYSKFINDGVKAITDFVERLNQFSRIEPSGSRTTIDLGVLVQMALFQVDALVRGSGAKVTYHDLPEIAVNESQFITLFENLIENAIKYRGSTAPAVDVSGEEADDGYVISVRDNAAGIDPRFSELVFRPFKRLHGAEIPGVGLGLAICGKIVAAHGGRIWVESDGKNGSTFRISIPF